MPFTVFLAVNRSSIGQSAGCMQAEGAAGELRRLKIRNTGVCASNRCLCPLSLSRVVEIQQGGQLDIEMGDANRLKLVRVFRRLNRRSNSPVAGDVADVYRRRTSPFFRVVHNTPLRTVLARKNRRKGILGTSSPDSWSYEISREKPGNMGISKLAPGNMEQTRINAKILLF